MQVKLIATDIDGTLLPYGQTALSPEFFSLLPRILDAGIVFCPASGRQLASIVRLFGDFAPRLAFVCDCGCDTYYHGGLMSLTPMPFDTAQGVVADLLTLPECEALVSTRSAQGLYLVCRGGIAPADLDQIGSSHLQIVADLAETEGDILRVSAYCRTSGLEVQAKVGAHFPALKVAVGSPAWLDFTCGDKGTGLTALCQKLGIGLENVVAFGDSYNDLPLLRTAGQPILMAGARPDLKSEFPVQCSRVEDVLRGILDRGGNFCG